MVNMKHLMIKEISLAKMTASLMLGSPSHLATMTLSFYVINTTIEMGCMVTNVTVHT